MLPWCVPPWCRCRAGGGGVLSFSTFYQKILITAAAKNGCNGGALKNTGGHRTKCSELFI